MEIDSETCWEICSVSDWDFAMATWWAESALATVNDSATDLVTYWAICLEL